MSFTSLIFIPFLCIVFSLYYLSGKFFRYFILLLANLFFIYTYLQYNAIVVLSFALISYLCGLLIDKNKKFIFLGIFGFLSAFIIFKYINVFNNSLYTPIGLSFYSFKIISYLIDIYKDKIKAEKNIIVYFNYILLFSTLISGPITRFDVYKKSLNHGFDYQKSRNGLFLCACGIFEKIVVANNFEIIVSNIFNNPELTGSFLVLGILLYALQIYIDFDSYSNIAIGLSKLLGIEVGINFNTPYLAGNIKEFWRRWHISLSSWFRDYVYIPLGGSKKGNFRKAFNIITVFGLSGIWHGSTLNYVIWGLGHGVLLVIEEWLMNLFKNIKVNKLFKYFINVIGIFINYILVAVLFVFFRFEHFKDAIQVLLNVFKPMKFDYHLILLSEKEWIWFLILIIAVIITEIIRYRVNLSEFIGQRIFIVRWLVYIIMLIVFIIFGIYGSLFNPTDFIYKHF